MATIEERAEQFANQKCNCVECQFLDCPKCDKYDKYVALYKEIALQQRQIDIDKTCSWLDLNLMEDGDDFNCIPIVTVACYEKPQEVISDFRQAMLKD